MWWCHRWDGSWDKERGGVCGVVGGCALIYLSLHLPLELPPHGAGSEDLLDVDVAVRLDEDHRELEEEGQAVEKDGLHNGACVIKLSSRLGGCFFWVDLYVLMHPWHARTDEGQPDPLLPPLHGA